MMFQRRFHEPIRRGEITCSVRIWQRPHVKVGGRYRIGDGEIEVTAIHEMTLEDITPAMARRSGFASLADLLKTARHGAGERVFLVDFQYLGQRAPDELPFLAELDDEAVAGLARRLDDMDRRSNSGPWTRVTLRMIADNPGLRATDLALAVGRARDGFKRDVRKLKNLGLTTSLETGYRLSPRGQSLLRRLDSYPNA